MTKKETSGEEIPKKESDLFSDKIVEKGKSPDVPAPVEVAEPADWIIVVDDSPANLTIICGVLNKLGFGTVSFRDGQLAMKGIEELPQAQREKICAIFSDLMMPNMDGLTLLREIRKSEKLAQTPFVVVTSSTERANIKEAGALKISGYLLKPITAGSITEAITNLFPNRRRNLSEEKVSIRRV